VQRPEDAQQVVDLVRVACCPIGGESLQLQLDQLDHLGVEQ
jgi:hypothetical protein